MKSVLFPEEKPKLRDFQTSKKYKILNDPIYGHVQIGKDVWNVIDTEEFSRLRDLKQLGTLYYVFPGASHNRFEHSIGVSHLSREWINKLIESSKGLEITEREKFLIEIAGLCHDLGHGPFSHVFDNLFIRKVLPQESWEHEEASVMMLKYMIEENNLDFDKNDIQFLENVIAPHKIPSYDSDRVFLYQIVANYQNSIDVDKFDYIQRDSHGLGLRFSFDHERLMKFSKVIDGQICFHAKEAYNLYEIFHTRYSLHKQIYSHRVGKSISFMVTDALLAADKYLKISSSIRDPKRYGKLTDCIIREIENSTCDELRESRGIIKRIRKRELYKLAHEVLITDKTQKVKVSDILGYHEGKELTEDDIIIDDARYNYAMKDKNPIDSTYFYSSNDKFLMTSDLVSFLIPSTFEERHIGLYVRDPKKLDVAREAFTKWAIASNIKSSPYKKH